MLCNGLSSGTKNHFEWFEELSGPDCIRYSHVYIPVKKVKDRHSTRTHWTFYLIHNIGLNSYAGTNSKWIVLDVLTFSTGKPCISWNTVIRPTHEQVVAWTTRSHSHCLRPLPCVYSSIRTAFSTRYNNRKFALNPLQRLDSLILC
ncbi:unnamed protein product [Peniophora sp. CBMAI 1063]|nr:unnamed protein product [Peniophora sp. CBMAI 1063]